MKIIDNRFLKLFICTLLIMLTIFNGAFGLKTIHAQSIPIDASKNSLKQFSATTTKSTIKKSSLSKITKINTNSMVINKKTYKIPKSLNSLLLKSNSKALKNASIQFYYDKNFTITKIIYLELKNGGKRAPTGKSQTSYSAVFDGKGQYIADKLRVNADYFILKNTKVNYDLEIGPVLKNKFLIQNVIVKRNLILLNGQALKTKALFEVEKSTINKFYVKNPNILVSIKALTKINEINVYVNSSLSAVSSVKLPKVNLQTTVKSIVLNGTINIVNIYAINPISISGKASIVRMNVNQNKSLTLNITGKITSLFIKQKATKIILLSKTTITTITSSTNLEISAAKTAIVNTINLGANVTNFKFNIDIPKIIVNSKSLLSITGTGTINNLVLNGNNNLNLNIIGKVNTITLLNAISKIQLGTNLIINNIVLPTNFKLEDIFNSIDLTKIINVNGGSNPWNKNHTPIVKNPLSNQKLNKGGESLLLNIGDVFSDPDNDSLSINAVSSNSSIATLTKNGSILILSPVEIGQVSILMTATDGKGGEVSSSFTIDVEPAINKPPTVINPISNQYLIDKGQDKIISINQVFVDPNNDSLKYTASSSDNSKVNVSVSGNTLTITPVGVGVSTITLTADDEKNGIKSVEFLVIVNSQNNNIPTVDAPISDKVLTIGGNTVTVDVSNTFKDVDQDNLTISATSSNSSIVNLIKNGNVITLNPVSSGAAVITITADDGKGGVAITTFNVNVNSPGNKIPTVNHIISDQILNVGGQVATIDLTNTFNDQDNDNLTLIVNSSNQTKATVTINNKLIIVNPVSEGVTTVTVTANDNKGGNVSTSFQVTVNPSINHIPTVNNNINSETITVGGGNKTVDATNTFVDTDGDNLTLSVSSSDPTKATVSISGKIITLTPVASGATTVTLTANDGKGGTISTTFAVTINPAANNVPTVITPINNQTVTVGGGNKTVDATNTFSDTDGDNLTLTVSSSVPTKATVSVSGKIITITPVASGTTTVTVTANDGKGGTINTTFTVTVNLAPNNVPTVANTLSNQTVTVGGGNKTVDATNTFSDTDGDNLTLSVSSSAPAKATVSVSGKIITITPVSSGTTTITVAANDGKGGTISTTLTVTVNPAPNHAPVVINPIPNKSGLLINNIIVDISNTFSDSDGDNLTITVTVNNALSVVLITGNIITIVPIAIGNVEVTVTADDGHGGNVSTTFYVSILLL